VQEELEARLQALKQEYEKGQTMLHEAELRRAELGETLLRISGAIQVLEELLGDQQALAEETAATPS
jgi:hypothetical protein